MPYKIDQNLFDEMNQQQKTIWRKYNWRGNAVVFHKFENWRIHKGLFGIDQIFHKINLKDYYIVIGVNKGG